MTTQAIDVVTVFHALEALENSFLGRDRAWRTGNTLQTVVFELYKRNKGLLSKLTGLKAKASVDWMELNNYLTANKFDPMFDGPLEGIGAVSILDLLVEWLKEARVCEIYANHSQYPAFEIPEGGHAAYDLDSQDLDFAVALATKTGETLWLSMPKVAPDGPHDLIRMAFLAMAKDRKPKPLVSTVRIPEVDFDIKPDLSFMLGAETDDTQGQLWYISQAYQQFKFRMNKEGAHAKVATGLAMRKGFSLDEPRPLIFDKPIIGWFTQPKARNLPIAIFYADFDSWKKAGNLRDM